jgi:hypothetical protein
MAATLDSHEMSKAGIRSIINVPIVVLGRSVGVLSFRREDERFSPGEVLLGRFLAIAVTPHSSMRQSSSRTRIAICRLTTYKRFGIRYWRVTT